MTERRLSDWIVLALMLGLLTTSVWVVWCHGEGGAEPPPPTLSPAGKWTMHWAGSDAPAVFQPQGGYACDWTDGRRWLGYWQLKGDTLTVEEFPAPQNPGDPIDCITLWAVKLTPGKREGALSCGGTFSLKP